MISGILNKVTTAVVIKLSKASIKIRFPVEYVDNIYVSKQIIGTEVVAILKYVIVSRGL